MLRKEKEIDIFGEDSTAISQSCCHDVSAECQLGSAAGAQTNTLERTDGRTNTHTAGFFKRFQINNNPAGET